MCWVTIITRNQSSASIIITLQFLGQQWKHLVRLGSLQLECELKWKTWDFWDTILVGEDSLADVWCLNVRQLTSWCDEIGKQLVGNQMSRVIILAQIKKSSSLWRENIAAGHWQTWWCYAWVILSQSKQTKLKFYPCLVSAMLGVLSSLSGGMLSQLSLEQYLAYFWTFHPRQTSLKLVSLVAIFWEWVDFKALKQISVVSNCHNSWQEKSVQSFISQDWLFIREPKATLAMVGAGWQ